MSWAGIILKGGTLRLPKMVTFPTKNNTKSLLDGHFSGIIKILLAINDENNDLRWVINDND